MRTRLTFRAAGAAAVARPAVAGEGRARPFAHPSVRPAARRLPRAGTAGAAVAVAAVAAINLGYRLGDPPRPVWDESYYLTATARYERREAGFASHPPLGLMLIAAGARVVGANAGTDWAAIASRKRIDGDRLPPGFAYAGVRAAPAAFGVLAAVLVLLAATRLAGSVGGGLFATAPFLFDTALVAHLRAAQLDAFQIAFAAAALLCLVAGDGGGGRRWTLSFGVACGLAAMVRANGVLLLAGAILPVARALRAGRGRGAAAGHAALAAAGFVAACAAVIACHLAVADRPMPAGCAAARADAPYVAAPYRAFLEARTGPTPSAILAAIDGYRRFMAADLTGVGLRDGNASSPWLWPLGRGAIVYRWDSDGRSTAYVALVPNLAAWAVSLAGVLGGVAALRRAPARGADDRPLIAALLGLWLLLMASAVALSCVRVMYLYHYLLPLVIGWTIAARLIGRATPRPWWPAAANAALALILADYLLLAPLALHRPLTDRGCRLRTILQRPAPCAHPPAAAAIARPGDGKAGDAR